MSVKMRVRKTASEELEEVDIPIFRTKLVMGICAYWVFFLGTYQWFMDCLAYKAPFGYRFMVVWLFCVIGGAAYNLGALYFLWLTKDWRD